MRHRNIFSTILEEEKEEEVVVIFFNGLNKE
jgi:hypothetical protein